MICWNWLTTPFFQINFSTWDDKYWDLFEIWKASCTQPDLSSARFGVWYRSNTWREHQNMLLTCGEVRLKILCPRGRVELRPKATDYESGPTQVGKWLIIMGSMVSASHGIQVGLSLGKHLPFITRTCRSRILPSRMDALPEVKPVLFVTFSPLYQSSS